MSITIRLAKHGKKHHNYYKIVVIQTRERREGKPIDSLGFYNPHDLKKGFLINHEKLTHWQNQGALISKTVQNLINKKENSAVQDKVEEKKQ